MSSATPLNELVTDTMGLILRIERRKMGPTASSIFKTAGAGHTIIYIPGIVLAEILYLTEKKKIKTSLDEVDNYLQRYPSYKEYPLNLGVVRATAQITDIPELHDRLIAGTARLLGLPLITNDPVIQASGFVKTQW